LHYFNNFFKSKYSILYLVYYIFLIKIIFINIFYEKIYFNYYKFYTCKIYIIYTTAFNLNTLFVIFI